MPRRAAALCLCFFGMALLDHGIAGVAAQISGPLPSGRGFDAFAEVAGRRRLVTEALQPAGLVVLILLALRIAIPQGVTRQDLGLLIGILFALTAGRSFLGIGEGFSTRFGLPVVICGLAALCLNQMIARRNRP